MIWKNEIILQTKTKFEFVDITDKIKQKIKESKINDGIVSIVSKHTTTAILLNENEKLLLEDFREVARCLLPIRHFFHDDTEARRKNCPELPENECQNGKAHCLSILLSNSQTLHIEDKELSLGTWQSVLFWELDEPKERTISIMIVGEKE